MKRYKKWLSLVRHIMDALMKWADEQQDEQHAEPEGHTKGQ